MRKTRVLLLIVALIGLACFALCNLNAQARRPAPVVSGGTKVTRSHSKQATFSVDLSAGKAVEQVADLAKVEPGKALSSQDTEALLKRLPAPPQEETLQKEFAKRESSLAAPRTGETIKVPFPAPSDLQPPQQPNDKEIDPGKLKVLRVSPEGEVPIAPQVSVTFSHPMVALSSQEETAKSVPVKLSPQPAGKWRWLGTKTIVFEPEATHMPMSTAYTVTIPKGTKSATGLTLDQDVSFNFDTPTLQFLSLYPRGDSQPLDPVMLLTFDQNIEAKKLVKFISLQADDKKIAFHLATEAEINADVRVKPLWEKGVKSRMLAIKADKELPKDSDVRAIVKAGAPSAEGSLTTTVQQDKSFETYGPFRLVEARCGWGNDKPVPGTPITLEFSNAIDDDFLDENIHISVTPELPNMRVSCSGRILTIGGGSKGQTTYKVKVSKDLRDEYGQTLGKDVNVSFTYGSASPRLVCLDGNMVVLDPQGERSYSVYTINESDLEIRLYKVEPQDWKEFLLWAREQCSWEVVNGRTKPSKRAPGKKVFDSVMKLPSHPDEFIENRIDLRPALNEQGLGHVVVFVKVPNSPKRPHNAPNITWVQSTQIGISTYADSQQLQVLLSSLRDGSPLTDGTVNGVHADSRGVVDLDAKTCKNSHGLLLAQVGKDSAFLEKVYDLMARTSSDDFLKWAVFSDRGLYKPKEKADFKGWIRLRPYGSKADIEQAASLISSVKWKAFDSRGNEFAQGELPVNAFGGFDLSFDIPDNVNLGKARLSLTAVLTAETEKHYKSLKGDLRGTSYAYNFEIQEFRRPEFEVSTTVADGIKVIGESGLITATAKYYAGGNLKGANTRWTVTTSSGSFTPPGWDEFIFGFWTPWWHRNEDENDGAKDNEQSVFATTTDSKGESVLKIAFNSSNEADRRPVPPTVVRAAAAISDLNNQTWSSNSTMLVHPSKLYVGLKPQRNFVQAGQPIKLQYVVSDLDGQAQSGVKVRLHSASIITAFRHGKFIETEKDVAEQVLNSSAQAAEAIITPKESGMYRLTAEVSDEEGRRNCTQLTVWVSGGTGIVNRRLKSDEIELIPDKKEYKIGETAEIMVQAPFYPAEGMYSLNREGTVYSERFTVTEPTYTIKVPIKEEYIPNLHLQVNLVGAKERQTDNGDKVADTKQPACASGHLNLSIPPYERTLSVEVKPQHKRLQPGANTGVEILVRDAQGHPVPNCEVALAAIDESVLALIGYKIPNPLLAFYGARAQEFASRDLREFVRLVNAEELEKNSAPRDMMDENVVYECAAVDGCARPMMGRAGAPMPGRALMKSMVAAPAMNGSAPQTEGPAIALRSDFNPQAVWMASLITDSNGRASTRYRLPDNLTRYRLTAVVVDKQKKFGLGEDTITACLPLMVRPSLPRFLNFGDVCELPIVLQNQSDKPLDVSVAVRAQNLDIQGVSGKSLKLAADQRCEVRFLARTKEAGQAKVQIAACAGDFADAAEVTLPVWTPCTTEAFATYGQIDDGAIKQPISYPKDVWPQFGQLEVTTSSTAVQELTDAFIYLQNYPYACTEQISSRVMSTLALKDVLQAFQAKGLPSEEKIKKMLAEDLATLSKRQEHNGGFRYWDDSEKIAPYASLHAVNAIVRAKQAGYKVSFDIDNVIRKGIGFCSNIESFIKTTDYTERSRRVMRAYALEVLHQAGKADVAKAKALVKEVGVTNLPLDALGWILPTLSENASSDAECAKMVDDIRRHLNNKVVETAGAANFSEHYDDGNYLVLSSDRRTDGILLRALIADQPKNDLIPKLVRGLLNHRVRGAWGNTQENVFILIALNDYFNTYEKTTPDFVAHIWLGDEYAGQHTFKGRSADYQQSDIPMQWLAAHPQTDLTLDKRGEGRLYYRLGLNYAPKSLQLDALDCGFEVTRSYEAVDNPDDVKRLADGTWQIKLGSRVKVKCAMTLPSRRYHVALVNPLPAGLEALNPSFKITEDIPKEENEIHDTWGPFRWLWGHWYDSANLRDERVEAFATLVYGGLYEYNVTARATAPGTFVVPPAKAEEMYSPEVFGRSASDKVIVK